MNTREAGQVGAWQQVKGFGYAAGTFIVSLGQQTFTLAVNSIKTVCKTVWETLKSAGRCVMGVVKGIGNLLFEVVRGAVVGVYQLYEGVVQALATVGLAATMANQLGREPAPAVVVEGAEWTHHGTVAQPMPATPMAPAGAEA